jgi:hypothetical protein
MSMTMFGAVATFVLSCVSCFFFGVLWGKESILKQRRDYHSFDPDQF